MLPRRRSISRSPLLTSPWAMLVVLVLATGLATAAGTDNDGDGYEPPEDCDDSDDKIHPGAADILCDGIDFNCDGVDIVDPDPLDDVDNDMDGQVDEGFGFCVFAEDGPGGVCKTAGRSVCEPGPGPPGVPGFGNLICRNDNGIVIMWSEESLLSAGSCTDGIDNDCDELTDVADPACQRPETCDGLDNDGDGQIDNGFAVGQACPSGVGACATSGVNVCAPDGGSVVCGATPGTPKREGTPFGNSCGDGQDNDCDGLTDAADPDCAGFGEPELCGNGLDDDGDGLVDEGFPSLGLPCSVGVGACAETGAYQCRPDGTGTVCSATPGSAGDESESAGTCHDFVDNDCDGLSDAGDPGCASAFSDLGVTCSLPYDRGKPGADCNGWHLVMFDGGLADQVQADLLALDVDGTQLAIIEDVQYGDEAHLASRRAPGDYKVSSKTNKKGTRHEVFAPLPVLRVRGTRNGVEDVAYCSILPYLEVDEPDGVTISLDDQSDVDVEALVPLVDVDTLSILLNGVDILTGIGIDPATAFPTATGGALCTNPAECVFQMAAGCGDGGLVDVEVSNLRVEGLDTSLAATAKDGSEVPEQVNTVRFNLSGLPPGGHVVYVTGAPLPLPRRLSSQCVVDDLADTGKASAFGIAVDAPFDQEIVAAGPVPVQGKVCGGNEIASLQINGLPVEVSGQTCTPGDGVTSADECALPFDVSVPEKDIGDAAQGTALRGTFKRGSNRVIADAIDVLGNRTFNTDTVFGLGTVQSPAASAAMAAELGVQSALGPVLADIQMAMTTSIDPAFVVGLEESAVQDFFNEKCQGAIDQYTARASATLQNKSFGTITIKPTCSCNLTSPVLLESVTFTPTSADPACAVDFSTDQIAVRVNLPDIRIQVGVHDSCTTRFLGACVARTRINVTAVTRIEDVAFDFAITETQIETKTPPDPTAFTFAWTVRDNDGTPLFASAGTCSGGSTPGRECYGDPGCDGGTCVGVMKNGKDQGFNPVVSQSSGIECLGGNICEAFQVLGAVVIEVFTLGFADGFEIVDILDFDFEFNEDFQTEIAASEPDAMQLDEIEVDEATVASAGHAQFSPGPIDVEIEDGGLTVAFGAEFSTQSVDPTVDPTPGAVLTPARVPTVSEVIAVGDDVTMLIADDVFGQVFASMKQSGNLQAQCNDLDGLTVDALLPAEADGGCESLGETDVAGAAARGLCHAIRGADCTALPDEGGVLLLNNTKAGVCAGFQGQDCSLLPLGQRIICNATPYRDIQSTDGVLLCARQDMEPDFLIEPDNTLDSTVDTRLILEDLNVVIALDRAGDGYAGTLEDLPGCFSDGGNGASDCLVFASCLDLTLRTRMGIDSSSCSPSEAGFVFALLQVIPSGSGINVGALCSSAVSDGDATVLTQSFESQVVDAVSQAADTFTPPICVEGLTLGGVLDFHSDEAKLFGLTTDGGTGFSDYLGITVGLGPPEP